MNVPGAVPGSAPLGGIIPGRGSEDGMDPQQKYEQKMIRWTQMAFESCPTKTVMSGVIGAGLGGMIGLFMSSMRYDTPLHLQPAGHTPISSLPLRAQLSHGLRDMGRSSLSSARNFGLVGAIFSGTECCIEGLRARNDMGNGVAAGCITGAGLAAKGGGPTGAAVGCIGFAAFSAAIDGYMRMEDKEDGARID